MSYFDVMLESEDQVLINKVIENATFQMCIEGGEAVIQDVEDYVDLLMTENYEPTPQFDEYMFESLSPYLEENAKYLGMFLFELTDEEKRVKREEIKKRRADAGISGSQISDKIINHVSKKTSDPLIHAKHFIRKTGLGLGIGANNKSVKHVAKGGIGSFMKRGLERAKIRIGNAGEKLGNKPGILGKISSASSRLKNSGKRGLVNITRTNLGLAKRK